MKRCAIFAILDNALTKTVRQYQESLLIVTGSPQAFRFPVHITLRGPFWTNPSDAESLIDRARLLTIKHIPKGMMIELSGPVFVEPSLCWLELKPGDPGYSGLSKLHAATEEMVSSVVFQDDVRSEHRGVGYRPHITLSWNADTSTCNEDTTKQGEKQLLGRIERLALAVYPDRWPNVGHVEIL